MSDKKKISRYCECGAPWVELESPPREIKPHGHTVEAYAAAEREGWKPDGARHLAPGFIVHFTCDRGHTIDRANEPYEWIEPPIPAEDWEAKPWREPFEVANGEFRYP